MIKYNYFLLINSLATITKASSTFDELLAEVSINGIPNELAYS